MKIKSVPIKVLDCNRKPVCVLAVRRVDFGFDEIFVLHRAIPYRDVEIHGWNVTHVASGCGVLGQAQSSMSKAARLSQDKIDSAGIEKVKAILKKYRRQHINSKNVCEKCQKLSLYSSTEKLKDKLEILAITRHAGIDGVGLPVEIIEHKTNNTILVRVKEHKGFSGTKTLDRNRPDGKAIHYQKNELVGFEFRIYQECVAMLPKSETKAI
jgi:hypothetical protein